MRWIAIIWLMLSVVIGNAADAFSARIIADSSVTLTTVQGTYDSGNFYTIVNAISGYKLLTVTQTNIQSSDIPGIPGQIFSFAIAGTNLWVMSKDALTPPLNIRHYGVTVPATAVIIETNGFGDMDSVGCQLAYTPSGGLFGYWFQNTTVEGPPGVFPLVVGIAHRSASGVWSNSTHSVVSDGGALASCGSTIAVYPGSNEAWAFIHRDSYHSIELIRMTENGNLYNVTVTASWITQLADGQNGPEGENPQLVAIADSLSGTIRFTYARNNFTNFSITPFLKGAYMAMANVSSDTSRTTSQFDNYIERTDTYGTWINASRQSILYREISLAAGRSTNAYWSSLSGGVWSTPTFLDEISGKFENSRDVPRIVYKDAITSDLILLEPAGNVPRNLKLRNIRLR